MLAGHGEPTLILDGKLNSLQTCSYLSDIFAVAVTSIHIFIRSASKWDVQNKHWAVTFRDLTTDIVFIRTATMLISAVGGISAPRDVCHF